MPALEAILYRTHRRQSSHTTQGSNLKARQVQGPQGRIKAWMAGFPGSAFCWAVAGGDISSVDGTRPPLKLLLLTTPQVQFKIAEKNVISLNHQTPMPPSAKGKGTTDKVRWQNSYDVAFSTPLFSKQCQWGFLCTVYLWDSESISNFWQMTESEKCFLSFTTGLTEGESTWVCSSRLAKS